VALSLGPSALAPPHRLLLLLLLGAPWVHPPYTSSLGDGSGATAGAPRGTPGAMRQWGWEEGVGGCLGGCLGAPRVGPLCTPGQHIMRLMGISPRGWMAAWQGQPDCDSPAAAASGVTVPRGAAPGPSGPGAEAQGGPLWVPAGAVEGTLRAVAAAVAAPGDPLRMESENCGLWAGGASAPGCTARGCHRSPPYMAPEVVTGEYSFPADVWSLGVVLHVLLGGTLAGTTDREVHASILAGGEGGTRRVAPSGCPALSDAQVGPCVPRGQGPGEGTPCALPRGAAHGRASAL